MPDVPDDCRFVPHADHAELHIPGPGSTEETIVFGEGWTPREVEAVLFERAGEAIARRRSDTHELLNEVLDASGWGVGRREAWLSEYFYASIEEREEEAALLRQWECAGNSPCGGTDAEDDVVPERRFG